MIASCPALLASYGLPAAPAGLTIPFALQSLYWSGPFNVMRGPLAVVGTTTDAIAATYLYQTAAITSLGGSPVSIMVSITYCPLNVTAVTGPITATVNGTRWNIWWAIDNTEPVIANLSPVQCMALAVLPTTPATLMSFQNNDGTTCPSSAFPAVGGWAPVSYTQPSSGAAAFLTAAAAIVAAAAVLASV